MITAPRMSIVLTLDARLDRARATIESLEQQTVQDFELVVACDDLALANAFTGELTASGSWLTPVSADQSLLVTAAETAPPARGSLVLLVTAGDVLDATAVEKCIWALGTRPGAAAGVLGVMPGARLLDREYVRPLSGPIADGDTNGPPPIVFRKSLWAALGGYDATLPPACRAWDLGIRAALSGASAFAVGERLVERAAGPPHIQSCNHELVRRYATDIHRRARFATGASDSARMAASRLFGRIVERGRAKLVSQGLPTARAWVRHPLRSLHVAVPTTAVARGARAFGLVRTAERLAVLPPVEPETEAPAELSHLSVRQRQAAHRVLILHTQLLLGGADRVLLDIIGRSDPMLLSFDVLTHSPGGGPWRERFARFTDQLYDMPAFLRPVDWPSFALQTIESHGVDVVLISNSDYGYRLSPAIKARFPGLPIVDLLHAEAPYQTWDNFRTGAHYRSFLDRRVVITESLARTQVEKYGEDADRITVIPNGVDTSGEYDPEHISQRGARKALGLPAKGGLVSFFGRYSSEKQPVTVLQVANAMAGTPDLHFALYGEGPLEPQMHEYVIEHRMGNVSIGRPTSQIAEVLAASDVLLFPSKREGLPVAGLEAMSMAKPVVAADVPGWNDLIVPGETGLLVPVDDVSAYVAAIEEILCDPARANEMGAHARARAVECYDVERMAGQWQTLLIGLAESRGTIAHA